jgi:hypothetical protein
MKSMANDKDRPRLHPDQVKQLAKVLARIALRITRDRLANAKGTG